MKERESKSHIRLFVTQWIAAHQTPLSLGFPRKESWSGYCYFLLQGIFPTQVSNPRSLRQQVDFFFFTTEPPGKTKVFGRVNLKSSHHTQTHTWVYEVLEVLTTFLWWPFPSIYIYQVITLYTLDLHNLVYHFSSVQPLSHVWLFATP